MQKVWLLNSVCIHAVWSGPSTSQDTIGLLAGSVASDQTELNQRLSFWKYICPDPYAFIRSRDNYFIGIGKCFHLTIVQKEYQSGMGVGKSNCADFISLAFRPSREISGRLDIVRDCITSWAYLLHSDTTGHRWVNMNVPISDILAQSPPAHVIKSRETLY